MSKKKIENKKKIITSLKDNNKFIEDKKSSKTTTPSKTTTLYEFWQKEIESEPKRENFEMINKELLNSMKKTSSKIAILFVKLSVKLAQGIRLINKKEILEGIGANLRTKNEWFTLLVTKKWLIPHPYHKEDYSLSENFVKFLNLNREIIYEKYRQLKEE